MRIAIIRRWNVSAIDGVNRFIFTLADGLERLGHQVVVLGHHMNEDPGNLFSVAVEVHTISSNACKGYLRCMWDWFIHGSRNLSRFRPDMVIVNGVVPLRLRTFKVAVNHGNAVFELRKSRLKRYVAKWLYSAFDRVICVSSKVSSEMKKLGLICDEVIPVPLILENYVPRPYSEREHIILHIGTSLRKRPNVSVKAVKLLRNLGYNIKLVIVGHYERKYDWVIIKKKCSDRELRELYSKALALMLPSSWEGLPYVVLEAQACGTPAIVGPGVPDEALVLGKSGFKIMSFNPHDYAEKLRVLLENNTLWKNMSKEARRHAENFDHIKISRRYTELYQVK